MFSLLSEILFTYFTYTIVYYLFEQIKSIINSHVMSHRSVYIFIDASLH